MSCIWKNKNGNLSSESSCSSVEYQAAVAIAFDAASASELSYLKGQVWSLGLQLKQSRQSVENLEDSFKKIANEKYELIQELTNQKLTTRRIYEELCNERENCSVLNEQIESLREEADKNRVLLEKVVTQNMELKESLMHANDTIQQLGLIYMKLKDSK